MFSTFKMKLVYLPFALAALLAALGLGINHMGGQQNFSSDSGQEVEVGTSQNLEEPRVSINGQPVDIGEDGQGNFDTGGANVKVSGSTTHVTSGGGRTVITNEDGTVNIQVESVTSGGTSKNKVKYDGDSSYEFHEESSIEVEAGADADISVSN